MITNQTAPLKAPKVGRSRQNRGAAKHTYFDTDIKDINQKPTSAGQNTSETDHAGEWELPQATKRRQAKQTLRKGKSLFRAVARHPHRTPGCQELKTCPQCPIATKRYDGKAYSALAVVLGSLSVGLLWVGRPGARCTRGGNCSLQFQRGSLHEEHFGTRNPRLTLNPQPARGIGMGVSGTQVDQL